MDEKLHKALAARFEDHRIVFWYNDKRDLQETFDSLPLDGITKLVMGEQPFGLKYRVLRGEPETKFLLFHDGPQPTNVEENWLYDVQLAHTVFHADQVSMWLNDLGLSPAFRNLAIEHGEYFRSRERLDKLKAVIKKDDTPEQLQSRMIYLACGNANSLDVAVEKLLAELVAEKSDSLRLLERTQLLPVLWAQLERRFGYISSQPDIEDFALELFKAHVPADISPSTSLSSDARVFFARWKSNIHCTVLKRWKRPSFAGWQMM